MDRSLKVISPLVRAFFAASALDRDAWLRWRLIVPSEMRSGVLSVVDYLRSLVDT